ncbi:MAG: hypothetical protein KKG73_14555 [Gammaproteobacteria bacterium]|nr:hypothetical protein [Gammaproteobacteria bacterium]
MIVPDKMTDKITLHGLGFIQVVLEGNQRLHVWHPELPRRKCYEHSAIHNHRFEFISRVLVGTQRNTIFNHFSANDGLHMTYLHEGSRSRNGGRPWTEDGRATFTVSTSQNITAGKEYYMPPYVFHRSDPLGNGKAATIMRKTHEATAGAHSSCLIGVEPDRDFDRYQLSPKQLWEFVEDVLLGESA